MSRNETVSVGRERIVKNTILLYIRMLVAMGVGLYTSRVILRNLGVTDFGLYNVAGAVVGMMSILIGSLSTATSRFIMVGLGSGDEGKLNRTYSTTVNIHLILAVVVAVLLASVGPWVLSSRINIPLERIDAVRFSFFCVVVSVSIGILAVPYNALIIAHEKMDAFAWFSLVDVFARLGIAYLINVTPLDHLKTYALMLAAVQVLYMGLNLGYSILKFRHVRYICCWDKELFKRIFAFAGWSLLTSIAIVLCSQCMTIINQRYFGAGMVAAFALAMTVQGHMMGFIANFKTAANPQIIKLHAAGQHQESRKLLLDAALLSIFIFIIMAVPLFVYADRVLSLWLEEVPQWTASFVRIVLVTSLFSLFDTSYYTALYAEGRLRESVVYNIIAGVISFLSAWGLICLTGNVYTASLVLCLNTFVAGFIVKPILLVKFVGYHHQEFWSLYKPTLRVVILSAFVGWISSLITPAGIPALFVGTFTMVVLIGLLCWFAGLSSAYRNRIFGVMAVKVPALRRFVK